MKIGKVQKILFGSVVATVGLSVNYPGSAQPQPSSATPMFENLTLSPDFSPDPLTIRGLSGGPVSAQKTTGREETPTGPCIGYVDEQPDHTLFLTEFFSFLSLQVQSSEDTVIVIRGPGGSWCNDDFADMNPGIAGQWLSGKYEIWVGSYEPNTYHPYVIRISDRESEN